MNLNPEQQRAVAHCDGPLLIFAGAGSGKTRVLTCRIANLIMKHGVPSERILAVTFTNKAAGEMKHRVQQYLGRHSADLWVSTFHASCARILRRHAALLDFTPQFAIYDRDESLAVLKKIYRRLDIDPRAVEPRSVLQFIDQAKNSYRSPDQAHQNGSFSFDNTRAELYEQYQEELRSANAMDFGDLLCNTVTLFRLEPTLLEEYRTQFSHVMVDEYQDTNHVQYLLVKLLTESHRNLCVVGDDDQSIYAFRGASVQNILSFKKDFPEAEVVLLEQNYRSTANIVKAANAVIRCNQSRQSKQMRTSNGPGPQVVLYTATDERDEARYVADELRQRIASGMSPSDLAVFYRTNAQSRAIEEALCLSGLPYTIFGGQRFYDRREIKDLLAYFRLALNPRDNEAFLRIVNSPTRGLGETALAQLQRYAYQAQLPLLSAAAQAVSDSSSGLSSAQCKRFRQFVEMMGRFSSEAQSLGAQLQERSVECLHPEMLLSTFLTTIAEESDYLPRLRAQETPEAESRVENIKELCAVALEFSRQMLEEQEQFSLQQFLDRTSLASDLDKDGGDDGRISLMTLHLAKGLEFEAAFLVGMEEGLLPHIRSLDSRQGLEEERRLCYVGITRARKLLQLSWAQNRSSLAAMTRQSGRRSRFLAELPDEVLEERGGNVYEPAWGTHELQYELDEEMVVNSRYIAGAPIIRRR